MNDDAFIENIAKMVLAIGICIFCLPALYFSVGGIQKDIKINLASVVINNDVEGHFTLGTGIIDTNTYYYAYEEYEDSSKQLAKYNSENTKIFEVLENTEQPYIVYNSILGIKTDMKMYVPKETITKTIDLDLDRISNK